MKEGFENKFMSVQEDMISICLEYIEDEGSKVYVYASYEQNCITCNFFFEINGKLYKKAKMPEGYDTSTERQRECIRILNEDMEQLRNICTEFEAEMPSEFKLVYDIKSHHFKTNYKYGDVYSNTDKFASNIFDEWFDEINNKLSLEKEYAQFSITKITGTNTYVDIEIDRITDKRTIRFYGEMVKGGFSCNKDSAKTWLIPFDEVISEAEKEIIIQKITEKTKDSQMVITFE